MEAGSVPAAEQDESTPAAPWNDDLETQFTDPAVRQQVDQFLRTTVQPYVTKIEQDSVPNRDAERLWKDFTDRPQDTFVTVAKELYGDEEAQRLLSALAGADPENGGNEPEEDGEIESAITRADLPAEVQEAVDFIREKQVEDAWNETYSKLKEDNPETKFNDDLFYPFVSAADGNVDLAVGMYKSWYEKAGEEFAPTIPENLTPEQEAQKQAEEAAAKPPPTLSPEHGQSAPPQESKPADLDEALDEWFNELKTAPPTV